jgi:hypothetical protein
LVSYPPRYIGSPPELAHWDAEESTEVFPAVRDADEAPDASDPPDESA